MDAESDCTEAGTMKDLQCWDCHIAMKLAGLAACARHATPEQRAEVLRGISEQALSENPMIAALRRPK